MLIKLYNIKIKRYEIKDHLGNVRAVTSDIKNSNNYNDVASSWKFLADIKSMSNYFPYGLKVKEGSWSASNYQFAYNGKQEEVFDKDFLDFGARSYDSEEIRFIKTDALENQFPFQSPYIYAGNNPILNIDENGLFTASVHKRITMNAATSSNLNTNISSRLAISSSYEADFLHPHVDIHFDGRKNYNEVTSTWNKLNKNLSNKINSLKPNDFKYSLSLNTTDIGIMIHTVQDFYAHSNYVELYIDYYKSKNDGNMPETIPIFENGIKDSEFNSILKGNLRTGDFDILINEYTQKLLPFIEFKEIESPTSHNKMNKDKADTPEGKLAEKVATEHTTKILGDINKKEQEIEK